MKNFLVKFTNVLSKVYGWGIFLCLFVGGLTFFGFLAAFIIGGDTATAICTFIHKNIFGVLIYAGNIFVLLGLLNMYLTKQKSLTVADENRESN